MKAIKLLSATLLLSIFLAGCKSLPTGETYDQLIARKSQPQAQIYRSPQGRTLDCVGTTCSGQPMRTYISRDGKKVVVFVYRAQFEFSSDCHVDDYGNGGCMPAYSKCVVAEERYKFTGNVVSDSTLIAGSGARMPSYSDACRGYDSVSTDW